MGGVPLVRICVLLLVLSAKLCYASCLTWPSGKALEEEDDSSRSLPPRYNYPTVTLSTSGWAANPKQGQKDYTDFITSLRNHLKGPNFETLYTIPVLRSKDKVGMPQRFVLARLSKSGSTFVTVALDVVNAYVVGYSAGRRSIFLKPDNSDDEAAIGNLFPETAERIVLCFDGSYGGLEAVAPSGRGKIGLGPESLAQAIDTMHHYHNKDDARQNAQLARDFIVVIQMVSEAARFRFIERLMGLRIRNRDDSPPHSSITSLENEWGALSKRVQESNQGMFKTSIQLENIDGTKVDVDNAERAAKFLSLMLFVCNPPQPPRSPSLSHRQQLLSAAAADHNNPLLLLLLPSLLKHTGTAGAAAATCPLKPQVTRQIAGPGGLCVEVRGGNYNNGNPIQLSPCRPASTSNRDNQLWTFMRDGTIRSRTKCMAASRATPAGSTIIISDCRPSNALFTWRVLVDGSIVSGAAAGGHLVLAAASSASGTALSIQENRYTPGQSWRPTTSAAAAPPAAGQIVGMGGALCLQANVAAAGNVLLRACAARAVEQQWARYPDGSIRPHQRRNACLAPPRSDQPLRVMDCQPNVSLQRWRFANDGTITNPFSRLVVDVRGSNPNNYQVVLTAFSATKQSQQWQALRF